MVDIFSTKIDETKLFPPPPIFPVKNWKYICSSDPLGGCSGHGGAVAFLVVSKRCAKEIAQGIATVQKSATAFFSPRHVPFLTNIFYLVFLGVSWPEELKNTKKSVEKKISQKNAILPQNNRPTSPLFYFGDFFCVFGRFSLRGVQKHDLKN